jgi:hypothetical protein
MRVTVFRASKIQIECGRYVLHFPKQCLRLLQLGMTRRFRKIVPKSELRKITLQYILLGVHLALEKKITVVII